MSNETIEIRVEHADTLLDGFGYACEKLGMAVWKLATGWDNLRQRLFDASIELLILQESDFPGDLVGEWKGICRDLTKGKMKYRLANKGGQLVNEPLGLVFSTVAYVRIDTAVDLARRICVLEAKVAERYTEERERK